MSYLLDVNFLLACGWRSHAQHAAARAWLERQSEFATNPISELGFLRVSMSPGYRASFVDAQTALAAITDQERCRFLGADLAADQIPVVTHHSDITDAYLVAAARKEGLKLATLDNELCSKSWASGIAENPL